MEWSIDNPFSKKKGQQKQAELKIWLFQLGQHDLTQDYRNILEINDFVGTLNEISIPLI